MKSSRHVGRPHRPMIRVTALLWVELRFHFVSSLLAEFMK